MRILILGCICLCSGCAHTANDSWTGKDKAEHFIASAALAAAGSEFAQHQHLNTRQSATYGLMFSVSLGAAKEGWDSRPSGSGWSWKDFSWDIAGAATGMALWNLSQH
jgi:Predicted periplasmic lipoprotein